MRKVRSSKNNDSRVRVMFEAFTISGLSGADFTNHAGHESPADSSLS